MGETVDQTDATGAAPAPHDQRMAQFRDEIGGMKLRGGSGENEHRLLIAGVILTVAGIALAVVGAIQVANFGGSPADQRAAMAQGSFIGIALIIAGSALFVRYSLGRYLRFWLIRLTYESRANTDRIVDAIERAAGGPGAVAPPPATIAPPPVAAASPPERPVAGEASA